MSYIGYVKKEGSQCHRYYLDCEFCHVELPLTATYFIHADSGDIILCYAGSNETCKRGWQTDFDREMSTEEMENIWGNFHCCLKCAADIDDSGYYLYNVFVDDPEYGSGFSYNSDKKSLQRNNANKKLKGVRKMTTELFKDGDHMSIYTEARDERDFIHEISTLFDEMIINCEFLGIDEEGIRSDEFVANKNEMENLKKPLEKTLKEQHKIMFFSDWEFQFEYWLPLIIDICCKYRGYKSNVHSRRVLIAGDPSVNGMEPIATTKKSEIKKAEPKKVEKKVSNKK
jgi:ribosomal protein L11